MSATHDRYDVLIPLVAMNASGGVRMVLGVANTLAARGRSVAVSTPSNAAPAPIPLNGGVALLVRHSYGPFVKRFELAGPLPAARVTVATGYRTPLLIAAGHPARAREDRLVYLIQNDEPTSHITYGSQPAWAKPALRWMARVGYRVPATRIAVSRFVADRVGAARIHRVIPAGIDPVFVDTGLTRRNDCTARRPGHRGRAGAPRARQGTEDRNRCLRLACRRRARWFRRLRRREPGDRPIVCRNHSRTRRRVRGSVTISSISIRSVTCSCFRHSSKASGSRRSRRWPAAPRSSSPIAAG